MVPPLWIPQKMECAFSAYGPDPLQKLALARVPRAILRTFPQEPKSDILTPGAWWRLVDTTSGKTALLAPQNEAQHFLLSCCHTFF